ncbi:uncharacterized protein PG986_001912 [Apiospora aurea]|uniref:Uncharacterized protein n=1 Tax=Apiospora aurea TaxID=335848 RepID=A0ABR1R006_9PEZI
MAQAEPPGCIEVIVGGPLVLLTLASLFSLIIAGAIVWTVIWLAMKLVALVLVPPAAILKRCCGLSFAEPALHWVLSLRWDWWEPPPKAKPASHGEPGIPLQTAAAEANAPPSPSSPNNQADPNNTPMDRDLELGLPEADPPGYTAFEMDITDSIHSAEAVPPYQPFCSDGSPPPIRRNRVWSICLGLVVLLVSLPSILLGGTGWNIFPEQGNGRSIRRLDASLDGIYEHYDGHVPWV